MTIKPLGKRILAKKIEPEQRKSAGGIVLPDNVKNDKVVRAKVLAVGTDEKFEVKVGDEVIVGSYSGTEIEQGEDKLILVKESDVLAVIEK
jgi:chaperonin GroES